MEVARETRFSVHSAPKLSVADFVHLVIGEVGKERSSSLNHLANELGQSSNALISKQGLDKRFSEKSVNLVKSLFEKAMGMHASPSVPLAEGVLDRFGRVRIKDGTRFDLDPAHSGHFAGFGGKCCSSSGMCVQFEYDLKAQSILEVGLTAANVPDGKGSGTFSVDILPGDLILRDLGYFNLSAIGQIVEKGAYVVTKLNNMTKLYARSEDGSLQAFDYRKVLSGLQGGVCEIPVLVGETAKIPMRLIISRTGAEVRDKRVRRANKASRKKGCSTTDLYRLKAGYNFLLTNIGPEVSALDTYSLYRLRWQVELVFKNFKSVYGIHKVSRMKFERWMTLFYARLLVIAVDFKLFQYRQGREHVLGKALLSIQKAARTYMGHLDDLLQMVAQGRERIDELTELRMGRLDRGHRLEKKKNARGLEDILMLSI